MSLNIEFQMLAYLKLSKLSSKEDFQKMLKRVKSLYVLVPV